MSKYHEEQDKAFNDVMEHMQKHEGYPINNGGKLPLPIRIIGYFMFGGAVLMIFFALIANFLFN